jgi:hypothetical protein
MSGPNYRRVAQREGVASTGSSDNLEANITRSRGARLTDKLVACEYLLCYITFYRVELHCVALHYILRVGVMCSFLLCGQHLYLNLTCHFIQWLGLLSLSWSLDGLTFIRHCGVEANPIEICSPLPFWEWESIRRSSCTWWCIFQR